MTGQKRRIEANERNFCNSLNQITKTVIVIAVSAAAASESAVVTLKMLLLPPCYEIAASDVLKKIFPLCRCTHASCSSGCGQNLQKIDSNWLRLLFNCVKDTSNCAHDLPIFKNRPCCACKRVFYLM